MVYSSLLLRTMQRNVLAVVRDERFATRLRVAFAENLRILTKARDLLVHANDTETSLLIVQPWDATGQPLAPVLQTLRARGFVRPIAAYVDARRESLHE